MDVFSNELKVRNKIQFSGTRFKTFLQSKQSVYGDGGSQFGQTKVGVGGYSPYSKEYMTETSPTKREYYNDYNPNLSQMTQNNSTNKNMDYSKAYFYKYIRVENKKYFDKLKESTLNTDQFVVYNKKTKLSYKEKVKSYLDTLNREEPDEDDLQEQQKEQKQQQKEEFIQSFYNKNKNKLDLTLPAISKNKAKFLNIQVQNDSQAEIDPSSILQLQKQNSQDGGGGLLQGGEIKDQKRFASVEPTKKKELPNYMRPNQAWLNKDKLYQQQQTATDSKRENSEHFSKSRTSFFPSVYNIRKQKKNQQLGEGGLNEEELVSLSKQIKQQNKYFIINREDQYIQELFKKICQERRESNILRAKLTKGKMKAHLSKKYKGKIAEKVLMHLDLSISLDFQAYCDMLERLLNVTPDKLKRIAFNVFDFNEDKFICQLDLYSMMKMQEFDDPVFVQSYSYDMCKLVGFLDKKKMQKGMMDMELKQKFKDIEKKVLLVTQNCMPRKANATGHSFSKNSGASRSASDQDADDDDDEDEEEVDQQTQHTGKTTKSRRTSVWSKKTQNLKRMNTNYSRASKMSKVSRGSGKSTVSRVSRRKSSQSVLSGIGRLGQEEEEQKIHPFDNIFGKKMYNQMVQKKDYIEKMNITEFKTIQWEYQFPTFIIDLFKYISGFVIDSYIKTKSEKQIEEEKIKVYQESISKRKENGELIDEKQMLELYKRQNMSEGDMELLMTKSKIGEFQYKKFLRFFRNVCQNPTEEKESLLFLNLESVQKKLKNHFGHKCDYLATRLYYYLSDNVNLKRIYFKDFIEKMLVLWEGTFRDQMRVAFKLIDIDHDGILNGIDLLTVQDSIDLDSVYGQEILALIDYYVTTHLMIKMRVNPIHYMHLDNYIKILKEKPSCMIDELKTKILAKAGKYAASSVMIRKDSGKDQSQNNNDGSRRGGQQNLPKRTILQSVGPKGRSIKRVTFAYIPPTKDDDDTKHNEHESKQKKKQVEKDEKLLQLQQADPLLQLANADLQIPAGDNTLKLTLENKET